MRSKLSFPYNVPLLGTRGDGLHIEMSDLLDMIGQLSCVRCTINVSLISNPGWAATTAVATVKIVKNATR